MSHVCVNDEVLLLLSVKNSMNSMSGDKTMSIGKAFQSTIDEGK